MKTIKTIGNCCLVFLCVVSVCVMIAYVYYHYFVKDITLGVNNVNDQIAVDVKKDEELTDEERNEFEERWFMEASYYSNTKNNGVQLQELKYNYFTGFNLTQDQYRSTGMQYLGDFETYTNDVGSEQEANQKILNEFYYYDTTNGITWSGFKGQYGSVATTLNREQQFVIKIDNRPFLIQLTGQYDVYGRLFGFLWYVKQSTAYFDYGDVFDCVFTAIKSNDRGYGDYYITLDLSQYFSIKEYDTTTNKFREDDVTDVIKNYAVLKFHYDENGARNSTQSLFGSIACNPKYDDNEEHTDTSYWQEKIVYTLDEKSKLNGKKIFDYRYSEAHEGYFVSLSMDAKKLLKEMPKTKVNVVIRIQEKPEIKGIDYNAFEGVELETLTVIGSGNLYIAEDALKDTGLKEIRHSKEITVIGNDGFAEVIV